MSEVSLPAPVRRDIESGVAAALKEPDLRAAVARAIGQPVPDTKDEVTLILLLMAATLGNSSWPSEWLGNTELAQHRDGFAIATIQALDMAQGRPARPLHDEHRECLAIWKESRYNES